MKAKDLLKYKKDLDAAISDSKTNLFFNDSILHAMMITNALFEKAALEPQKNVCMYCGEFSLFRDKTKSKVLNEKMECSTDGLEEYELKMWEKISFFTDLQESLEKFLKNGTLKVIIANNVKTIPEESVWSIIEPYINNKKVEIYELKSNVGLDHFATTNDSYRIENSDKDKTAICCFRDKLNADVLQNNFKDLLKLSQLVEF